MICSVAMLACGDGLAPVAPVTAGPQTTSSAQLATSAATAGEPDDVLDALDRIAPAFGTTGPAEQLRAALQRLADDARAGASDAVRRDAVLVSLALDRIEALGDPSLGAEIGAVRLVADARK